MSSSNFPRLDLNPNTGEAMGRHTHTVVANNALHCDSVHCSRLELPCLSRTGSTGATSRL